MCGSRDLGAGGLPVLEGGCGFAVPANHGRDADVPRLTPLAAQAALDGHDAGLVAEPDGCDAGQAQVHDAPPCRRLVPLVVAFFAGLAAVFVVRLVARFGPVAAGWVSGSG